MYSYLSALATPMASLNKELTSTIVSIYYSLCQYMITLVVMDATSGHKMSHVPIDDAPGKLEELVKHLRKLKDQFLNEMQEQSTRQTTNNAYHIRATSSPEIMIL